MLTCAGLPSAFDSCSVTSPRNPSGTLSLLTFVVTVNKGIFGLRESFVVRALLKLLFSSLLHSIGVMMLTLPKKTPN